MTNAKIYDREYIFQVLILIDFTVKLSCNIFIRSQNGYTRDFIEGHLRNTFIHVNIYMFLPIQESFNQGVDPAVF